jgi:nucleotide-binding universal stress UspA family protein
LVCKISKFPDKLLGELLINRQNTLNLGLNMPQSFDDILLLVDGSPQSRVAENMALTISKLFNSQITLIHVISSDLWSLLQRVYVPRENLAPINTATGQFPRTLIIPQPEEYLIPDSVVKEAIESYTERAEILLSDSASLLNKEGIRVVKKKVTSSNVADAIIEEIVSGQYNLVIMGNTGSEEAPLDLHLGSVAAKVSSSNLIPTLIVRRKTQLRSILLCIENTSKDQNAVEITRLLGKAADAKVILLHVQEKSLLRFGPQIREVGQQMLLQAKDMLEGLDVEQFFISGDPAALILDKAESANVDLVVLGRGGHGRLSHLLGSVSNHVLHYATVPVLIVK